MPNQDYHYGHDLRYMMISRFIFIFLFLLVVTGVSCYLQYQIGNKNILYAILTGIVALATFCISFSFVYNLSQNFFVATSQVLLASTCIFFLSVIFYVGSQTKELIPMLADPITHFFTAIFLLLCFYSYSSEFLGWR